MDRFLINKRPVSVSPSRSSSSLNKKPRLCAKQGNVSAADRVAEFGKHLFYADGGKLFCRPCNFVVDHFRKDSATKHVNSKVSSLLVVYLYAFWTNKASLKPQQYISLCKESVDVVFNKMDNYFHFSTSKFGTTY